MLWKGYVGCTVGESVEPTGKVPSQFTQWAMTAGVKPGQKTVVSVGLVIEDRSWCAEWNKVRTCCAAKVVHQWWHLLHLGVYRTDGIMECQLQLSHGETQRRLTRWLKDSSISIFWSVEPVRWQGNSNGSLVLNVEYFLYFSIFYFPHQIQEL